MQQLASCIEAVSVSFKLQKWVWQIQNFRHALMCTNFLAIYIPKPHHFNYTCSAPVLPFDISVDWPQNANFCIPQH